MLGTRKRIAASLAVATVLAAAATAQRTTRPRPERPEDAPGTAALPVAGAPRASDVVQGSFTSVQVNIDAAGSNIPGDAANEPSITVDPNDPSRIVIGWRQFDTIASNFRQAGRAYSHDGGKTWTDPGPLTPGTFGSDPVLAVDSGGTFYYASIDAGLATRLFRSLDGGVTWQGPAAALGGDKEWIAVDRSGGIGDGNVYEAWSVYAGCCGSNTFTRSVDGGLSFATAAPIPSSPIFGTMDVDSDGDLFIGGVDPNDFGKFVVARSSTVQDPAAPLAFDFATTVLLGGALPSGGFGTPNPDGLLGQVDVAANPSSGAHADEVYLLCSVDPPGPDPCDVMFARSTDGGRSFGTPVRVNDDAAGKWDWFGTMAVAPDGRIDVVWNDGSAEDYRFSQLRYSSSSDGGVTWSPSIVLSPRWNSTLGWPNQNKIGDYYDMVSDAGGAHLAWAATFNGEEDVYYLHICAQEGPASSVVRNGTGVNPLGFT